MESIYRRLGIIIGNAKKNFVTVPLFGRIILLQMTERKIMSELTSEQIEEALSLIRLLAEASGELDVYYMRKCLGTDHFNQARRLIQRIDNSEIHGVFGFDIDGLAGHLDACLDAIGHTDANSKDWLDDYVTGHGLQNG